MVTKFILTRAGQRYDLRMMLVNHGRLATRRFITNELKDFFPTPVWTRTEYDSEGSMLAVNECWITLDGLLNHLDSVAAYFLRQDSANKADIS